MKSAIAKATGNLPISSFGISVNSVGANVLQLSFVAQTTIESDGVKTVTTVTVRTENGLEKAVVASFLFSVEKGGIKLMVCLRF